MKTAVASACPGCKRNLRIPVQWVGQTMRCKFCGNIMEARRRVPMAGAFVQPIQTPPIASGYPTAVPGAGWTQPATQPINGYPQALGYPPASQYYPSPSAYPADPFAIPPAAATPEFTADNYAPAFSSSGSKHRGRGKYKGPANSSLGKLIVVGGVVLAVTVFVVVILVKPDLFSQKPDPAAKAVAAKDKDKGKAEQPATVAPNVAGPFPRRMLSVSVNNYLYANAVQYGESRGPEADRRDTHTVVMRFADRWRIPRDQVYELTDGVLSDTARPVKKKDAAVRVPGDPPEAKKYNTSSPPPLKEVIQKTITSFCDGCRAQDRLVFLFTGHAIEKDGEAYFVPLEGEFDDLPSLIPLKEIYEKIGKAKGQEKLVIWDVCRMDTGRGTERPAFGKMTEGLEKALHNPPPGVSVWTSCSKDQYAYELDYGADQGREVWGSFFLSQFLHASHEGAFSKTGKKASGGIQTPEEPLPIEPLEKYIARKTSEMAKAIQAAEQTPKYTAAAPGTAVPFDPKEALAARFDLPAPPPGASKAEVAAMVAEIRLPPVKAIRKDVPEIQIDTNFPFTAEALKDYMSDGVSNDEIMKNQMKYPVRAAVLEVVADLRKLYAEGSETELPEEFRGQNGDEAKKRILAIQRGPAVIEAALNDMKMKLDMVAEMKEKDPSKRWQAHYDYVSAQVRMRIAYMSEYNLALGKVRKDELPPLDEKKGHRGWRLAAAEKMKSPKEIRDLAEEARSTLTDLAKSHAHTPWAVLAKRERFTALGLEWQASSFGVE